MVHHPQHCRRPRTGRCLSKALSALPFTLLALLPVAATAQQPAQQPAQQAAQQADQPAPAVVVAAVETKTVDKSARFIGNVQAIESVDLKARVAGFLTNVAFEQGSNVAQGQVLYSIEQDQYQADLQQAQGQLAAAKADVAAATAKLEDKEADFQRQATLIKKGDTSQTAFDQSKAARDSAQADLEKAEASVQQAQAGVDNATINLGYTTIASPIAGRIGATAVTAGNLVEPNTGTLATVAQLDPIRAVFSVPSAELLRLQGQVGATTDAEAREAFVPELVLPDGSRYDKPGTIAFTDNQVDATTGTVAVYADFPNPDRLLLPGQFVSVVVHRANQERQPVVPAAAVQRTRDGAEVYVVDAQDKVQARKVELGTAVDDGYAVTAGLTEGELVIVAGLQKVKPGMTVQPSRADGAQPAASGRDSAATLGAGNGAGGNGAGGSGSSADDGQGGD